MLLAGAQEQQGGLAAALKRWAPSPGELGQLERLLGRYSRPAAEDVLLSALDQGLEHATLTLLELLQLGAQVSVTPAAGSFRIAELLLRRASPYCCELSRLLLTPTMFVPCCKVRDCCAAASCSIAYCLYNLWLP